jgi:hypothetical protein
MVDTELSDAATLHTHGQRVAFLDAFAVTHHRKPALLIEWRDLANAVPPELVRIVVVRWLGLGSFRHMSLLVKFWSWVLLRLFEGGVNLACQRNGVDDRK